MTYQRRMPREELFSVQLEMLMQTGRQATLGSHLVGIAAAVLLFWTYLPLPTILLWAALFIILLLLRSLQMSNALVEHRYLTSARRVYWELLLGAALTGAVWAFIYIYAANRVPIPLQYTLLLLIIMITAFSLGFSVLVREHFIVCVFSTLWPIAWWSLVHYWQQPHNLVIGLSLLGFCILLVGVSERMYRSFRNMITLNWERETLSQELSDLTGSLRSRNRQLRDARRQLTDLANIDELTGLGNRRLVNQVLQEEINRARRGGGQLSLILVDVDNFKHYNDAYGHPEGDRVLQQLADLMQRATSRAGEVVGRFGGEEFILILPNADGDSALRTAERLRELIAEEAIEHKASEVAGVITVSQGLVTVSPREDMEPAELIKQADAALYEAKREGRDRVVAGGASQGP